MKMKRSPIITLCGTGKSGLGHLRRLTNVAWELRKQCPDARIRLLTNASIDGLPENERRLYDQIGFAPRAEMPRWITTNPGDLVVVDTAALRGLDAVSEPLCLILRETTSVTLPEFGLANGRPWDLMILPNPLGDWKPKCDAIHAKACAAVGYIYRAPEERADRVNAISELKRNGAPVILIASGGGGKLATRAYLGNLLEPLLGALSDGLPKGTRIVQNCRSLEREAARLPGVTDAVDIGPYLNEVFATADLVISTAGYNSVLEMAQTDVPVVLTPIPRTIDDQKARADRWSGRLGRVLDEVNSQEVADWVRGTVVEGRRRNPVTLGSSGAQVAASHILRLVA